MIEQDLSSEAKKIEIELNDAQKSGEALLGPEAYQRAHRYWKRVLREMHSPVMDRGRQWMALTEQALQEMHVEAAARKLDQKTRMEKLSDGVEPVLMTDRNIKCRKNSRCDRATEK